MGGRPTRPVRIVSELNLPAIYNRKHCICPIYNTGSIVSELNLPAIYNGLGTMHTMAVLYLN